MLLMYLLIFDFQEITKKLGEIEYHEAPGRIFNSEVSTRNHPESRP